MTVRLVRRNFIELWIRVSEADEANAERIENTHSIEWVIEMEVLYNRLFAEMQAPCNFTRLCAVQEEIMAKQKRANVIADETLLIRRVFSGRPIVLDDTVGETSSAVRWIVFFCLMYSDTYEIPAELWNKLDQADHLLKSDDAFSFARQCRTYFNKYHVNLGKWGATFIEAERNYIRHMVVLYTDCTKVNVLRGLYLEAKDATLPSTSKCVDFNKTRALWTMHEAHYQEVIRDVEDKPLIESTKRIIRAALKVKRASADIEIEEQNAIDQYAIYNARYVRKRLFTDKEKETYQQLNKKIQDWIGQ